MRGTKQILFARTLTLVLGLFLLLPAATTFAQSQSGWWNNGQRRDQRRERRQERRERRQERREERRERRDDRWDDRRDGRWDDRRDGRWDNYGNYGGNAQLRQTALNAGYNEGIQEGRNDASRRERFDYSDESDYRNATKDYSSRLGDRGLYQRYFREGFARGYNDGYRATGYGY